MIQKIQSNEASHRLKIALRAAALSTAFPMPNLRYYSNSNSNSDMITLLIWLVLFVCGIREIL